MTTPTMREELDSIIAEMRDAAKGRPDSPFAATVNRWAKDLAALAPSTQQGGDLAGLADAMRVVADRITTRADAYFGRCGEMDVQRMGFRSYAHEIRALADTIPHADDYTATSAPGVDDAMERAWPAYLAADCAPFTDHRRTRLRAALEAALTQPTDCPFCGRKGKHTRQEACPALNSPEGVDLVEKQPTEGSGPSVAGGDRG